MKVQTSGLIGFALDWVVNDIELARRAAAGERLRPWVISSHAKCQGRVHFSGDGPTGDPVIEREGIEVRQSHDGTWVATPKTAIEADEHGGATRLVAAMRCYVSSLRGDAVDIPPQLFEELCSETDEARPSRDVPRG